jgi:Glycosyl hydrolases family 25
MSSSVKGFDISSNNHNGMPFNWPEAKAAGYEAVYIKATQGDSYVNPYFIQDCRDAKNAGLEVGIYHYFVATVPVADQVTYFKTNGMAQVSKFTTLVPMLDVETGNPGLALEDEVNAFLAAIPAVVYMDRSFNQGMPTLDDPIGDWLAWPGWTEADQTPAQCIAVQYEQVVVPGIGQNPNGKYLLTDVDSFLDLERLKTVTPEPVPVEKNLNAPIVGMAICPGGYWLAGADGGVFCFGDAVEYGTATTEKLNRPIVGIVASETGKGYALVGADGGVFCFGDFEMQGSIPGIGIGPAPE